MGMLRNFAAQRGHVTHLNGQDIWTSADRGAAALYTMKKDSGVSITWSCISPSGQSLARGHKDNMTPGHYPKHFNQVIARLADKLFPNAAVGRVSITSS